MLEFQKSFPAFNEKKEFFITGESYAGHYLPNLAHFLLEKQNPNYFRNVLKRDWTLPLAREA